MAKKRDYYDILGVAKGASTKEIKAAYRKLARQFHPDVNKGDSAAEDRFKEISEAFAVLSDDEKRAKYDRGGHDAFGPGFDPFSGADFGEFDLDLGNLSDLFGMFGGGRRRSRGRTKRGADLKMELAVRFEDAVRGATVKIRVPRKIACAGCSGTGARTGGGTPVCTACGGSGRAQQRSGGLNIALTCPRCGGTGRLPGPSCGECRGSGRQPHDEQVTLRIPPGVADGSTLRLAGKGDAGRSGGASGDVLLTLRVRPHTLFRRDDRDLSCDVPVSLARAALGGAVVVPTLDGQSTIRIPEGTRSGQRFRLKGQGVAAAEGRAAGDLFAVIQIHPPKRLDRESRRLLEELQQLHPEPN